MTNEMKMYIVVIRNDTIKYNKDIDISEARI